MANLKLDILAIAAHPDDAELSCSGTLIKHKKLGCSTGILNLTEGELGSRGDATTRKEEAKAAAQIMNLDALETLSLGDGFFEVEKDALIKVIEQIRRFKPDIVLCNSLSDRHPDHGRGGDLASRACFLSGLQKISTTFEGQEQDCWRPKAVYRYIQDRYIKPDFVVDITDEYDIKKQAILAYASQFYNPSNKSPETPISSKEFLDFIEARARNFGRDIGAKYAEGFNVERTIGVNDLFNLV